MSVVDTHPGVGGINSVAKWRSPTARLWLVRLWRLRCIIVGGLLVVAGFMKAFDSSFVLRVATYFHLDATAGEIALWFLVAFEMLLGSVLIVSNTLRWPAVLTLLTFAGFTGFLTYLLFAPDAPDCGCFGRYLVTDAARDGHLLGIARNAAVLIPGVVLFIMTRPSSQVAE